MMTPTDLRQLFRQVLKPVLGGPPVGTVGSNRTAGVLAALDALADNGNTPTNALRGTPKFVRFETREQLDDAIEQGYGGNCLDDLDPGTVCLGGTVRIEFPLPGASKDRVAVYDPAGPTGYRTGDFVEGDTISFAWVDPASLAAARANIRAWSAGILDWAAGETLTATVGGTEGFYKTKAAGGPFPAPTGPDDTYYKQVAPPISPAARARALTAADARLLLLDGGEQILDGFPYLILRDTGNVSLLGVAPDAARGYGGTFSPTGIWQTAAGPVQVSYDVTGDTPVPVGAGGVGGAPAWVAGPQLAGQLSYDAGAVYRAKTAIANSASAPSGNPANYERVSPKYYAATGQNTDGSLTQKAATDAFALKASVFNTVDWTNETEIGTAAFSFGLGRAGVITDPGAGGFELPSAGRSAVLTAQIGRLVQLRATVACTYGTGTLPDGSPNLINGSGADIAHAANEWRLYRRTATGYDIVMRGTVAAPGATPAPDSISEAQLTPAVRVKLNAAGGQGNNVLDYEAEHNGISGFSDQTLTTDFDLTTVGLAYNVSTWRWQLLNAAGSAIGPIRTTIADCNTDLATARAATPALAYVRARHEVVRATTGDVGSYTFTYTPR